MREQAEDTERSFFHHRAEDYAAARPRYPEVLFSWLVAQLPDRAARRLVAWDCATGNGQAASGLVEHVDQVIATDISPTQLSLAAAHPRITYRVAEAERSGIADQSVSLICVATAAHWFDLDAFYEEVRRVAIEGALVALWTYADHHIASPDVTEITRHYAQEIVGEYWRPANKDYVATCYASLPFPFEEIDAIPSFCATSLVDQARYEAYLRSWSASQAYLVDRHRDPIASIHDALSAAWAEPRYEMQWPLHMRCGRVS